MPKFLGRIQYTREGLEGTVKEGFAEREKYVCNLYESMGLKVEALYWAYGEDDLFVVVDADAADVVAMSLAANVSGMGRTTITPLLTAEEMDAAVSAMPKNYRPAGI